MSQYSKQGFFKRLEKRGLTSETVFSWWAEENRVALWRIGFDNPPFKAFKAIPEHVRHLPDMWCEDQGGVLREFPQGKGHKHFSVEIKSVGREEIIKIKRVDFEPLQRWEQYSERPVFFFVYDSVKRRHSHLIHLSSILETPFVRGKFPDGNDFRGYSIDNFEWLPVPSDRRFINEREYDPNLDEGYTVEMKNGWHYV